MAADEVTVRDLLERDMDEVRRMLGQIVEQQRTDRDAASREHAEERAELREVRAKLDGMVPRTEYAAFKQHVYERLDAHDRDLDARQGADRMLTRLAALTVGSATVGGVALTILTRLAG